MDLREFVRLNVDSSCEAHALLSASDLIWFWLPTVRRVYQLFWELLRRRSLAFCISWWEIWETCRPGERKNQTITLATPILKLAGIRQTQLQCARHTFAIGRIGSPTVGNMALQHLGRGAVYRASCIVKKQLLFLRSHIPEEIARLFPMILLGAVVIVIRVTIECER